MRLADALPFTHSVSGAEERTAFGLPSINYSADLFKVLSQKIPDPFPGSGDMFSFVLPHLNATGTKTYTSLTLRRFPFGRRISSRPSTNGTSHEWQALLFRRRTPPQAWHSEMGEAGQAKW